MKSIVEIFEESFMTDDVLTFEQKERKMIDLYDECNTEQRYAVDMMFIHLCGYSFETLNKKRKDD